MRLNYDLLRSLLLTIEEAVDGETRFTSFARNFPDENPKVLHYHMKYLHDVGFLEMGANDTITDITPQGRQFLDGIRDDALWAKARRKIHPFDSVAVEAVRASYRSLGLQQLADGGIA